jgi:hypothetical protein
MLSMSPLLILHISLGVLLLLAFIVRYIAVLTKKITPQTGRSAMTILATALVASGVAVGIVYKAPITGDCLKSLGIIALVIVLEYGLQSVALSIGVV